MRLSSRATFFYKRVFPFTFVGFVLVFAAIPLFDVFNANPYSLLPFIVVPAVLLAGHYFIMKKLVLDLVDEVFEQGGTLLVRNGGREDRIALTDIINVNYNTFMSPPRVTLSLRKPSLFGSQVSFCAPLRFNPFATSPVIDKFILRVDAARFQAA
jgi:hypothetical protein